MKNKALLSIGPITPPVGGTTVLFEDFLDYLKGENDYGYTNSLRSNSSKNKVFSEAILLFQFILWCFKKRKKSKVVMFHASSNRMLMTGVWLSFLSKPLGFKLYFRKFGGDFDKVLQGRIKKILFEILISSASLIYIETKNEINFITREFKCDEKIKWFPNVRKSIDKSINKVKPDNFLLKCVFIGRVIKDKGIVDILESLKHVNIKINVDIYGPIEDKAILELINKSEYATYSGVKKSENIISTLLNYDLLLLPTYYEGEGYPGVIIEAFSIGMPVITTNWKAIPEIAVDGYNSIIISPKDVHGLTSAIKKISETPTLFEHLSINAKESFKSFNREVVYENVLADLKYESEKK